MGALKNFWLEMLTPVDTTVSVEAVERTENLRHCNGVTAYSMGGICKCIFWWAVALAIGMLLARLH